MTREKQIEYFKGCLMATGREGVEDLLDFIEELGFYDAPASGGNHCCKDGGLLEHTVNVMQYAEKIGLTLLGSEAYNKIHSSVIIASALHDLGKCGRYGSPYYVENMVQDGRPTKKNPEQKYKRSESKPYKISSDLCHIDHPLRSVELAARYIDLTEEEEHAIFYHDGAYGSLAYDLKGHEEPLQVIIHFADFWSAQFLEVGKLDRFNDQSTPEETTDKLCKDVVRYTMFDQHINEEIDQFVDAKKQIIKEIRGLRDKNMIQILTKVYVQFKTVKVASQEMKKSYSYTVELHNKALSAFEDTYKNLTYLT